MHGRVFETLLAYILFGMRLASHFLPDRNSGLTVATKTHFLFISIVSLVAFGQWMMFTVNKEVVSPLIDNFINDACNQVHSLRIGVVKVTMGALTLYICIMRQGLQQKRWSPIIQPANDHNANHPLSRRCPLNTLFQIWRLALYFRWLLMADVIIVSSSMSILNVYVIIRIVSLQFRGGQ